MKMSKKNLLHYNIILSGRVSGNLWLLLIVVIIIILRYDGAIKAIW